MSHRLTTLPIAAFVATLTLSACSADAEADASPTASNAPAQTLVVAPALLEALGDARERVLPTVDADIQTALGIALVELQAALDAGQLNRSRRAIASARALLASHADSPDGDSADLASVSVLLIAVDQALR